MLTHLGQFSIMESILTCALDRPPCSLDKESQVLAIGSHHGNDKCKWDMDGALIICVMQSFAVGTKNSWARSQRVGWTRMSFKKNSGLPISKANGVSEGYSHGPLSPQSLTQSCSISTKYNYNVTRKLTLSFIVVNEISECKCCCFHASVYFV